MAVSIAAALGSGSGIDTVKLVGDLVDASRQPRAKTINARETLATARLSTIATLSSGLTTIADSSRSKLRTLGDADIPNFVEDMVGAINELRGQLSEAMRAAAPGSAAGPLAGDSGARTLSRALSALAGSTVTTSSLRLTDIGITTNRDGTLALDEGKLASALASDTPGVKALLGVGVVAASGFAANLQALKFDMVGTRGALTATKTVYSREMAGVLRDRSRLDSDMSLMTDRLTRSFAAMDARVATIKASQAYLTQQVAMWTAQR